MPRGAFVVLIPLTTDYQHQKNKTETAEKVTHGSASRAGNDFLYFWVHQSHLAGQRERGGILSLALTQQKQCKLEWFQGYPTWRRHSELATGVRAGGRGLFSCTATPNGSGTTAHTLISSRNCSGATHSWHHHQKFWMPIITDRATTGLCGPAEPF